MTAPMRMGRVVVLAFLVALGAACTQFAVKVVQDPSFDIAGSRSWDWLPPDLITPADQRLPDPYLGRKLMATADEVLSAKGYQHVSEAPDLYFNYRLTTNPQVNVDFPPRYKLGWWGMGGYSKVDSYDIGTLVLDAVDARTKTLVWRGTATTRLLTITSLDRRVERVEDAVQKMLKSFPAHRQP